MSPAGSRRVDPRAVLAVAAGALVGGPLRYAIGQWLPNSSAAFPWSTFTVNVAGSFVLAALLVVALEAAWSVRYLREFAGVGVLGSFTTFSAWMLQLRDQAAANSWGLLTAYLAGSLIAGLIAASLGLTVGRFMTSRNRGR
jgi:CrcB protein